MGHVQRVNFQLFTGDGELATGILDPPGPKEAPCLIMAVLIKRDQSEVGSEAKKSVNRSVRMAYNGQHDHLHIMAALFEETVCATVGDHTRARKRKYLGREARTGRNHNIRSHHYQCGEARRLRTGETTLGRVLLWDR